MDPQAGLDPQIIKSFDAVTDLVKQLLTLSTGIVALTLSFLKDVMRSVPPRTGWIIRFAWLLHGLSVWFGVLALMAIVGTLGTSSASGVVYRSNISLWVGLQIVSFGFATVLVVAFGYRAFAVKPAPALTAGATPGAIPGATAAVAESTAAPAVSTGIAELQQLVDEGRIEEARALLAALERDAPSDATVVQWSKVLGKPRMTTASSWAASVGESIAWLKEHAAAHEGQWVAIRGGELLGSARDRVELHRKLEAEGRLVGATFVCVGEPVQ